MIKINVEIGKRKFEITLKEEGAIFLDENDWPEDNRVYRYDIFDEKQVAYYSHSDPLESFAEAGAMAMQRIIEEMKL